MLLRKAESIHKQLGGDGGADASHGDKVKRKILKVEQLIYEIENLQGEKDSLGNYKEE